MLMYKYLQAVLIAAGEESLFATLGSEWFIEGAMLLFSDRKACTTVECE